MKHYLNFLIIISLAILFTSCSNNQISSEILQSNSATTISRDYKDITKLLIRYKKILDKRNPNLYNKNLAYNIISDIKNNQNTIHLLRDDSYKKYLEKAFDENTPNRSDFLILGIYKMLFNTYNIQDGHQITALGYNAETFKKTYYTLKVLRWKIRNAKNSQNRFIYATWQLNWQLEFNKKYNNISINNLKNLPSLKKQKESIMGHNNFNFEIILSLIIDRVKDSLNAMGEEPLNLSITAMKAIIFL